MISFPIEENGQEKFNFKNPASKEVVKKLLNLRIEEESDRIDLIADWFFVYSASCCGRNPGQKVSEFSYLIF